MPRRLAAVLLVAAGAALAEGTPAWFADEDASPVRAKWGIRGTDAVGFEILCLAPGEVSLRPALFAVAEPASAPTVRFDVDGSRYERPASLAYSERDGAFQATAVVGRTDPLIDALRRGTAVTYDFEPPLREGDAFTVSLSGSAKAIDTALAGC